MHWQTCPAGWRAQHACCPPRLRTAFGLCCRGSIGRGSPRAFRWVVNFVCKCALVHSCAHSCRTAAAQSAACCVVADASHAAHAVCDSIWQWTWANSWKSACDADEAGRRAALGQQIVTAAMRVLLIALATALVLRTGAIQFFAAALSGAAKGSGGSAGATSAGAAAAAASAFLVPGLRRRLLSPAARQLLGELEMCLPGLYTHAPTALLVVTLQHSNIPPDVSPMHLPAGGNHTRRDVSAAVAEATADAADSDHQPEKAEDTREAETNAGVQAPASVWLPYKTASEKKVQHCELARLESC